MLFDSSTTQVYVGPILVAPPGANWFWRESCHMFVAPDANVEALHIMAIWIGLIPKWFQEPRGRMPHYDLTPNKRRQAIAVGALSVDAREETRIVRLWREYQQTKGQIVT